MSPLSTGSKKIFLEKWGKKVNSQGVEGGGGPSLEDMSPKKSSFSLLTPSLRVLKNCRHVNILTILYIRNDDIIQFYIWSGQMKKNIKTLFFLDGVIFIFPNSVTFFQVVWVYLILGPCKSLFRTSAVKLNYDLYYD